MEIDDLMDLKIFFPIKIRGTDENLSAVIIRYGTEVLYYSNNQYKIFFLLIFYTKMIIIADDNRYGNYRGSD